MTLALYMDENVDGRVTEGLLRRNIDVVTVQTDGRAGLADDRVLERATELGRLLFSQDADLLILGVARQRRGQHFTGVVYGHQADLSVREFIDDLEYVAYCLEPAEVIGQILYLPLR